MFSARNHHGQRSSVLSRRHHELRGSTTGQALEATVAFVLLVCLALPVAAPARTWHVPADVPTIEGAVDQAQPHDTVLVTAGAYYPQRAIVFSRASVTLLSDGTGETDILVNTATLDPAVLQIQQDGCVVQGFTIFAPLSNLIQVLRSGSRIEGNHLIGRALRLGIYVNGGSQTVIRDNRIEGCIEAIGSSGSDDLVEGNTLLGNYGSGISVQSGTVRGNTVQWNRSYFDDGTPGDGAGIAVSGASGSVLIQGNTLEDGQCDGWGGGQGQGKGGGVYIANSADVTVDTNVIQRNQALLGAGIYAESSHLVVRGNLLWANRDSTDFTQNPLRGTGGAIYLLGCTGSVTGNSCADNVAMVDGGAAWVQNSPAVAFSQNIFAVNRSQGAGLSVQGGAPLTFTCNDAWGNGSQNYGGWPDPTGSHGNISLDPEFCGPGSGDFRLEDGSPCLPGNAPSGCGQIGAFGGCGIAGVTVGGKPAGAGPNLLDVYPNPSATGVTIRSRVVEGAAPVNLEILDCSGRFVRAWALRSGGSGRVEARWDGTSATGVRSPAGVYFARLWTPGGDVRRKLILLR